jgi:DNA replication and repair protein RecF
MAGIENLTLSHFRSHRRAEMQLDGRPVALFGANGAGKTNILEAVSLLSPGRGLRRAMAEDLARRPEALGWKITARFGAGASAALQDLATWAEPGRSRDVRINGKAATQSALAQVVRMVWLVPAMDRLWIEGAEGRRRFLDRLTLSLAPDHADLALAYEKAMRERNRLLKDQITDPGWYQALEARMAASGAGLIANRRHAVARLMAAQNAGQSAFPTADLVLIGPQADPMPMSEADLATALAESRRRDLAAGRSLTGPHRADLGAIFRAKGMPAAQCSTGEQKALLIALLLANARALWQDTGTAPILLLDEVAAHLDSNRRAALYDELLGLGAQAFMTGTGAELFDSLAGQAQYFEVVDQEGLSTVLEKDGT